MDAVVRYSPHSTPSQQRFLILKPTRHTLKFHQIEHIKGPYIKYKQLSQHTDFSTVRAFDWSPTDEAVVAVGLSSGEAALLRVDDNSNAVLSFNFKNPRPCNAIGLGVKGHLAAGLDKVRNDFCLNIWDIHQRIAGWDRAAKGWASTRPRSEPLRKLAPSETISSLRFFSQSPDTLVAGVKGQCVRIYDLREYPGDASIQFPTHCTHNISIDTQDENYFASASGAGESTIYVWDRRAGMPHTAATLSSGHASQPGPVLEFHHCLEVSETGSPPSIWSVRFCRFRRGVFGVLSSQGQLRVFEMAKEYVPPASRGNAAEPTGRQRQLLYTKRSQDVHQLSLARHENPAEVQRIESFDFMASDPTTGRHRLVLYRVNGSLENFELHPDPPLMDHSVLGDVMVAMSGRPPADGSGASTTSLLEIRPVESKPGPIARALERIRAKVHAARDKEEQVSGRSRPVLSSREERLRNLDVVGPPGFRLDIKEALLLGTAERRRAEEGYLFDCAVNARIVSDDPGLRGLWRWLRGAEEKARDGGMVYRHLDLSYLGVHYIWRAQLGPTSSRRIKTEDGRQPTKEEFIQAVQAIGKRQRRSQFKGIPTTKYPDLRLLGLAICGWIISAEQFESELRRMQTHESRSRAAAWAMFHGYPKRAIEVVLQGDDGDKLVAMALAAFNNRHAGLGHDDHENDDNDDTGAWSALCNEIREQAKDPWSKAILALVSTQAWKAVVAEQSLPLRDRVGVALKYLEDDELTDFLDAVTRDCVEQGDIEGIVLTGLSEEAADLFQNYIIRRSDVQTAVLVMSHAIPRFFDDYRFYHWRVAYCHRLEMYGLHLERCLYTQQHSKRSLAGRGLTRPTPRQITIRCSHCDQSVVEVADVDPHPTDAGDDDALATAAVAMDASFSSTGDTVDGAPTSSGTHPGNPLTQIRHRRRSSTPGVAVVGVVAAADAAEALCPRCGRHLPRCGVCLSWLGPGINQGQAGGIINDATEAANPEARNVLEATNGAAAEDVMARFLNFCNRCHHGFHALHARQWFAVHRMCPVPRCECLCAP
ncbi:MAG: hypothetical protein M1826_001249 [Phylliscum demangeonii]|nr:MAG: hypothetical protein M1826_001249 [Phylliscum demangeonii]